MIPELGHFALIIAFCLTCLQSLLPLWGVQRGNAALMHYSRSLASGQFVFVLLSFLCLCYAFVVDDFSVAYVAQNSNTLLPLQYKISAVWGAHEGSLLLWVLMLSGWTLAVAIFSRALPLDIVARVIAVMGMITIGFMLFTLVTSNPFERLLPAAPVEGRDLNPLLQDFGLIVHPPMLYMGYVGFSVAFAFAVAALLSGKLDSAWARWSRPWTTVAWGFLTLGIALGSWWAYYELGWGGWWFWDPVENASFMPWLAGTALMHSLAVTEKRGLFKSWTVLLAIFTFSLSLLGAFLVRSGVLTSVHAFASDPERGVFILIFLGVVVGGSLLLYALRAPVVRSAGQFAMSSRESLLLVNNVILVVATLVVLLGTLYPLFLDLIGSTKLSVGPPYFNLLFIPLTALLVAAMGFGVLLRWKQTPFNELLKRLWGSAVLALVVGLLTPLVFFDGFNWQVWLGMMMVVWVLAFSAKDIRLKLRHQTMSWAALAKLGRSYWGMVFAHMGVAFTILGVCLVSNYSEELDLRMQPGDEVALVGHRFVFNGTQVVQGPNYVSDAGVVEVYRGDRLVSTLTAEKRRYHARGDVMTEAGIDAGLFRDLYVALGENLGGSAWSVRVHYKAFVRWIWLGAIFMAFGGFLAISDKRYRKRVAAKVAAPKPKASAGVNPVEVQGS